MGNFWWWAVLTGAHVVLFALLWRYRRGDHPWLLVFYGAPWLADFIGLLIYPTKLGGLNLLGPVVGSTAGRLTLFYLSNMAWFVFWILPAMAAERLALGRLRRFWLPALIVFAVVWAFVVYGYMSRTLSRQLYLGLIHWAVEPVLLVYALVHLVIYIQRCLRDALHVELLTLALMLECTNLTLKLIFAIQPSLALDRSFSALYHTVCLMTFFGYYAVVKVRIRRLEDQAPRPESLA